MIYSFRFVFSLLSCYVPPLNTMRLGGEVDANLIEPAAIVLEGLGILALL